MELLAGKSTPVGAVTAWIENNRLYVKYTVNAPWTMTESHLDIREDWRLIPQTKKHNPIPGHFTYSARHEPTVSEYVYQQELPEAPPQTFYIAAHAEVVSPTSSSSSEGAWGAGTRFTNRGNWATFFTLVPQGEAVLDEGTDWMLMNVRGYDEETGEFHNVNAYTLNGTAGIANSPLPDWAKEDLAQEIEPGEEDVMLFVNQALMNEIELALQQGATANDRSETNTAGDNSLQPLWHCDSDNKSRSKSFSFTKSLSHSVGIGSNVTGTVSLHGEMEGEGGLQILVRVKKCLGIPYAIKFKHARVYGNIDLDHDSTVSATLNYHPDPWEWSLAKLNLGSVWIYWLKIKFALPITMGLEFDASVTGSITYGGLQRASGSFDYTCTSSGCSGSANYNMSKAQEPEAPTGSLSTQINVSTWMQVAVRASLYTDSIFYAQVGVRPTLLSDIWGYYGNDCGDAAGDGQPDMLNALTFDLDGQVFLTGQTSNLWRSTPRRWNDLAHTQRYHLDFWNLGDSEAMQPLLSGPATVPVGATREYAVRMRPCWPYDDDVKYSLRWGEGTSTSLNGAPWSSLLASHAWSQSGTMQLTAIAQRDTHGRVLNRATTRSIQIVASSPNEPPAFATGTPSSFTSNITYNCYGIGQAEPVSHQFHASDPDGAPVSFLLRTTNGSEIPPNVTLSSSGAFSWDGLGLGQVSPPVQEPTTETLSLIVMAMDDGLGGSTEWPLTLQAVHGTQPACLPPPGGTCPPRKPGDPPHYCDEP